jgi:hypothetical protein
MMMRVGNGCASATAETMPITAMRAGIRFRSRCIRNKQGQRTKLMHESPGTHVPGNFHAPYPSVRDQQAGDKRMQLPGNRFLAQVPGIQLLEVHQEMQQIRTA